MSLDLRSLYRQLAPSGTRLVYVTSTGNDSTGTGAIGSPWATINKACSVAVAGDRILVGAGTYGYTTLTSKLGTAQAWISVESLNDTVRPIISVADNSGDDGFDIQGSIFVGVYGLEIVGLQTSTNTNPSGFGVWNGSHHVRIWNNYVHDFPGGGINNFNTHIGWDLVDVSFNTIHDCCKYSPYNTSGISFYGAIDLTGTTLDGRYGYRAVGNYIYNCICTVNYTPGGLAYVTDGNGVSCDSLNTPNSLNPSLPPYTKRGLVCGNVVVGCGGRGLHVYNTINVDDLFNTYIGNLRTTSPAITNGVEADAQYDTSPGANGVTHYGNLICPTNTPNSTDAVSTYTANVILGGTQTVPAGNTDRRGSGVAYFTGAPTNTQLQSALTMPNFIPVTPDTASITAGAIGYQALGSDPRPPSAWSVGALEAALPVRYFGHP